MNTAETLAQAEESAAKIDATLADTQFDTWAILLGIGTQIMFTKFGTNGQGAVNLTVREQELHDLAKRIDLKTPNGLLVFDAIHSLAEVENNIISGKSGAPVRGVERMPG